MIDLDAIKARAAARVAVAAASDASNTPPAKAANRLIQPANVSQLASLARVASQPQPAAACTNCRHFSRVKTCAEPVAAGLAVGFEIVWPPEGYGTNCAAFDAKPAVTVTILRVSK